LPAAAADYLLIGNAQEAASGDGSIIEVLPYSTPTIKTVT
jgi:hypothetical protein